jgi:hypothetical protein
MVFVLFLTAGRSERAAGLDAQTKKEGRWGDVSLVCDHDLGSHVPHGAGASRHLVRVAELRTLHRARERKVANLELHVVVQEQIGGL